MNKTTSKVLIIVGPAGSGKSTLAKYISDKLNWQCVEEDKYWVKNGWGSGLRSTDQEKIVQSQVIDDLQEVINRGKSAVLEFVLYKNPPNPLTVYSEFLEKNSITYNVMALLPTVEEILRRMKKRGRDSDINNLGEKRKLADQQLEILNDQYIKPEWIVDPTEMSLESLYEKCLELIG